MQAMTEVEKEYDKLYTTNEKPIRMLGNAARHVAEGDFSVRLPKLHKGSKKDYMDVMFEDFNTMVEELNSIETLKDDFEPIWEEKGLLMEVDVDDRCIINQDEALLELVWNNLISNAIKFTPEGGKVKITQRADEASIYVEVSDSGCGMDEATRKRIFDKFYQGDASHAQAGNGLGLALALRALKLVDGEVAVASAPEEGSTFTVWLEKE